MTNSKAYTPLDIDYVKSELSKGEKSLRAICLEKGYSYRTAIYRLSKHQESRKRIDDERKSTRPRKHRTVLDTLGTPRIVSVDPKGGLHVWECPICGKHFCPTGLISDYAYKRRAHTRWYLFCSWGCLRKAEEEV